MKTAFVFFIIGMYCAKNCTWNSKPCFENFRVMKYSSLSMVNISILVLFSRFEFIFILKSYQVDDERKCVYSTTPGILRTQISSWHGAIGRFLDFLVIHEISSRLCRYYNRIKSILLIATSTNETDSKTIIWHIRY